MLQIENKILSLDIIQDKFACDIEKCKGACCIHGDAGAPLEDNEIKLLDEEYEKIKPYLRKEAIEEIEKKGKYYVDEEKDTVTMLVNKEECAYAIFENGIAFCGIEKAYFDGATTFRKPVSCHLYPIRTKTYRSFEGMHYDRWDICKDAITKGEKEDIPVYIFVKDALIRKYGKDFYKELTIAAEDINKKGININL